MEDFFFNDVSCCSGTLKMGRQDSYLWAPKLVMLGGPDLDRFHPHINLIV